MNLVLGKKDNDKLWVNLVYAFEIKSSISDNPITCIDAYIVDYHPYDS